MKKLIMLAIFFIAIGGVSAAPIVMTGSGSGNLDIDYTNSVYSDVSHVGSASFDLTTNYDTDTVVRAFSIKDSYNHVMGTGSAPNTPDFGQFTTTETATLNAVYHDVTFEKRYSNYLPAEVKTTSNIDFGTQQVNLFSRLQAEGDWATTQQVGNTEYTNFVNAREYTMGGINNLKTDTDFVAETTNFYSAPSPVYVPSNILVYVGDNDGATINGNIGGIGVAFTGNLYNFDHTNVPSNKGFNFAVVN